MEFWLPLLVIISSLLTGVFILMIKDERETSRTILNIGGALIKIGLLFFMLWGVFHQRSFITRINFIPNMDFVLRADGMTILFSSLSALLWLLTTVYAIGYFKNGTNRRRFFGYFSFCVTATMGISLAGNLVTFFLFYEMLTLTTYPLVTHNGTKEAAKAGRIYLIYTLSGSALILAGMVWLYALTGPVDFTETGYVRAILDGNEVQLTIIFILLMLGMGVKAALFPFHGWLPKAMVAPAPVSALLHAVAVVKAGTFGMVRIVYDVFGVSVCDELNLLQGFMILASITIVYGSVCALFQDDFKKRLAYSTVSQVSYILLGITMFGPLGTIGGLTHLVHQGIMKITMFFCAGNIAETLHVKKISEMKGIGRRMPLTMTAFSIAALGMIGVPPMVAFISKWYLGLGAVASGNHWVLIVLVLSSLLNAAYFLPILKTVWFDQPDGAWQHEPRKTRFELSRWMLYPPIVTAALTLLVGLLAGFDFSPVSWSQLIAGREY